MAQYGRINDQGGYGQSNPYAQESGPYAQQSVNPHAPEIGAGYGQAQGGYGSQQQAGYGDRYGQGQTTGTTGTGGYVGGNNVEMTPMNGSAGAHGQQATRDPNAILNECRNIDRGIDSIETNLERLRFLQQRAIDDPDASQGTQTNRELDSLSSETMTLYRSFAARIKTIKQQKESGDPRNAPQVGRIDRKLKKAINEYQNVEADFRRKLGEQMARQYRIVRPDASESEVQEAIQDTSNNQVFSQALLQSDRRGQSQSALRAVQGRHEAIQKIEQQMYELAQLFQDMEALVVQQEPAVADVEQKSEGIQTNVGKANVEMDGAIKSARSRNRKKWWCLLICLIIIIIIVLVVVLVIKLRPQTPAPAKSGP